MTWFKKLFGSNENTETHPEYSSAIAKIESVLAHLPEAEAQFLACAGLLAARVAHADDHVSESERAAIRELFKTELSLTEEHAAAVTEIAIASELSLAIEYHLVTRKLNEFATKEQKLSLIRLLFQVAREDDITETESDKIGGIASALLLSRSEYVQIRAEFSQYRSILKNLPK